MRLTAKDVRIALNAALREGMPDWKIRTVRRALFIRSSHWLNAV